MGGAACKVIINRDFKAARERLEEMVKAFHEQVELEGFSKLSDEEQSKAYDRRIATETKLTAILDEWCDLEVEAGLRLGTRIDEAS